MDFSDKHILDASKAALLIIDLQERLMAAMQPEHVEKTNRNLGILTEAAKRLGLPILVTEQYPKGLGATTAEIAGLIGDVTPVEKTEFSCCQNDDFAAELGRSGRKQVIITGSETHVCVLQTCLDLLARDHAVFVVSDACTSRFTYNWRSGLEMMRDAGAVVTNAESVAFALLGKAGGDDFKAISKLVR